MRLYTSIYITLEEGEDSTPFESQLSNMLLELRQKFPTLDWDSTWEIDTEEEA